MLPTFFSSLVEVLEPTTLGLMLLGVAIGFLVGILPGLGGSVTLALMLPFTYNMQPVEAFAFLLGISVVTSTAGDITSVLFGIPGEATSAAVVLDGYPMARRGEAGRALGAVLFSSVLGAWLGALALAASIPIIRPVVLALGPPEFFVLTLLGLAFIATLSGRNIGKGLVMACLGLLVAAVGIDPQAGIPRYVFGQLYLWDGINIVPLVVGLFGGAEVLQIMLSKQSIAGEGADVTSGLSGVRTGITDTLRHWRVVIRASLIGIGIGVVPGMGGSVAQFVAYGQAQQSSKRPELFGKGSIEGVIAAGANNNAKDSGSLIPTIAFGIPGSVASAVLLSAFLITGLTPGPEMLTSQLNVTFSMVWVTVLANIVAVMVAFALLKPLTRLTFISGPLLVPFLLIVLGLGAFTASNSFADVMVMLVAAGVGVAAIRWDWPRVPFLLAVVLGGIAERYLFLSYSLFGWAWLTRPIVLLLFAILALLALRQVLVARRRDRGAVNT
ncbi:MAG: tripartite tricarboxylate transporter permease [Euzebyales bacterium]|nr:tripartite tricarboxylate transporter permease [Euzebyales bacterium]MDQ3344227.1 tripartite tricarboxylate transporter permease [Actinomycetota bacterium]